MSKLSMLAIALFFVASAPAHAAEWIKMDGEAAFEYEGRDRQTACALDPPGTSSFAFYVRPGDPDRLAIFFDGGGACWDPNTCLAFPTYDREADSPEDLAGFGGLGEVSARNPIAGATQVFIPYCTGDLHTGANDQPYSHPVFGIPETTIRHRGADNVAFVLKWLRAHYEDVGNPPRDVFLSGASAGGYGVLYHTPAVADMLPWYTRIRVLVDAANGVITQDFYERTLAPGGVWNVQQNLSPVLSSAFAAGADDVTVETFKALAGTYPGARFGQYTTAYDAVQIAFFNLARNTDRPDLWEDPTELALSAFEWTIRARTYMNLVALQAWNYRYYIAAGTEHTVVGSDKFYTEDSAGGVDFVDWVGDMINRRWLWWGSDWRNVSCTPNCLVPE